MDTKSNSVIPGRRTDVLPDAPNSQFPDIIETVAKLNNITREQLMDDPSLFERLFDKQMARERSELKRLALTETGRTYLECCKDVMTFQRQGLEATLNGQLKIGKMQVTNQLSKAATEIWIEFDRQLSAAQNQALECIGRDLAISEKIQDKRLRERYRTSTYERMETLFEYFNTLQNEFRNAINASVTSVQ